jgi:hypothetical protein
MADLKGSQAYDLVDSSGSTWEVKYDRLWHVTGNVYIEMQALSVSQADRYIIFAGPAYVVAKSTLTEAIAGYEFTRGGDFDKSVGVCLPLETLEEASEMTIVL